MCGGQRRASIVRSSHFVRTAAICIRVWSLRSDRGIGGRTDILGMAALADDADLVGGRCGAASLEGGNGQSAAPGPVDKTEEADTGRGACRTRGRPAFHAAFGEALLAEHAMSRRRAPGGEYSRLSQLAEARTARSAAAKQGTPSTTGGEQGERRELVPRNPCLLEISAEDMRRVQSGRTVPFVPSALLRYGGLVQAEACASGSVARSSRLLRRTSSPAAMPGSCLRWLWRTRSASTGLQFGRVCWAWAPPFCLETGLR